MIFSHMTNLAFEPESIQQSTVWIFQYEPKSLKVVCAKITLKQMIAYFKGINRHIVTMLLENSNEQYIIIYLPKDLRK